MKKPRPKPETRLPAVSANEVEEWMPKTATVNLRLTEGDKAAMEKAKEAAGLTLTEYLVGCHRLVSRHMPQPRAKATRRKR